MHTPTELALDPPRAAGAPLGSAVIRSTPEDFQVDERLGFEPSGSGEHLLLRVRKRGQNTAQSIIAKSDADLASDRAEAKRRIEAAQKVAEARALQEGYKAQEEAELSRASREKAQQQADQIVKAEIDKERVRIDAEAKAAQTKILQEGVSAAYVIQKDAEAEGVRRVAEGEASGIRAKLTAEASGIQAKLTAEAEGTARDAKEHGSVENKPAIPN